MTITGLSRLKRPVALASLGLALASTPNAPAQVVRPEPTPGDIEERTITARGGLDPFDARSDQELMAIFDDAEGLFASAQQPDSIEVFGGLISRLESDHQAGVLSEDLFGILILSYARRAEAHFNLGQGTNAEQDLTRLLALEPGWALDPDMVSPKLVELLDRLRRQTVGNLLFQIEPSDVVVLLDGRPFEIREGLQPVLAGRHVLHVSRPGFEALENSVEVSAGETVPVEATLERVSSVIQMRASPPGAQVLIDGAPALVSRRSVSDGPESEASSEVESLEIEGLQPGSHELSFELPGYRQLQLRVDVESLADYSHAQVELEPSRGEILLSQVPPNARITLDGRPARAELQPDATARLDLPPGHYRLAVQLPGVGVFNRSVSVEDRKVDKLAVELEPSIAFLGVLGNDRLAAETLTKHLAEGFGSSQSWAWIDRSSEAPELAARLGLGVDVLRQLGMRGFDESPDAARIRDRAVGVGEESLYLLAVLGDDLYATTADLWLWSAFPWPPAPVVRPISLTSDDRSLPDFVAAFDRSVVKRRAHLGVCLIDSAAASGPVVSAVLPGGPAESVGIKEGDEIQQLNRQPMATTAELLNRVAELGAGARTMIRFARPGDSGEETVVLAEGYELISLTGADVLEPILAARLAIELRRREPALPLWVLQLQQAAIYLRASAFDEAVPVLRTVEAPERPGLGRATADYWLGLTLLSIDPITYADAARTALERVLATPGARLGSDDGPLLAPRARARLEEMNRLDLMRSISP